MQAMGAKAGLVTLNFMVAISRPNHVESIAKAASLAESSAILEEVPRHHTVSGFGSARTSGEIRLG